MANAHPGTEEPGRWRGTVSAAGRHAARARNWNQAEACGRALLGAAPADPEGHFLVGLACAGTHRSAAAIESFERVLELDAGRYDAAVELATQLQRLGRHGEAVQLLREREAQLANSPYYLDRAATVLSNAGLPEPAWRLLRKADALQPDVDALRARLAAASVHVGRPDEARSIYEGLLRKNPRHQRNHYELSRLRPATDRQHVDQMLAVLAETRQPPARNIYLYYALGKELEDLGAWDEAFRWYRMAGDAAASVADYDVAEDLALIDTVIDTCTAGWYGSGSAPAEPKSPVPIFVVGLPRSGTTLVERVLSGHSAICTAGESFFVPAALRQLAGENSSGPMCPAVVRSAAAQPAAALASAYLRDVRYRLDDAPYFVEKLPENVLYLGFLARAFPNAPLVHVRRQPMDACFAMYKQSFFRYAYTLADLGRYYPAYDRLTRHWRDVLGNRVVEIGYEALVTRPEATVRRLFERIGIPFEQACLDTELNPAATNTASAVQVRERIHTRSVGRWRHFAAYLEPLARDLRDAGIPVESHSPAD